MNKLKRYFKFFINHQKSLAPKKNVFILSHMRSTSSLLSHILSTHEQICGHRELHSSYTKRSHIIKTRAALYVENKSFEKSTYLADKLLHNRLIIDENIFNITPKYIFLLRDPQRTMSSMIKMHLDDNNSLENIYKLEDYYLNRIDTMMDYWKNLKGDKIYISSEDLLQNTDNILNEISDFLALSKPLSENYEIHNDTGRGGIGDPSINIQSGKILKSTPIDSQGKELLNELNMDKIYSHYLKATKLFI